MTTSETIDQIATALAKAQAQMKNAPLNKVNPHFKSKFADLASVRDTVVPALSANGISIAQTLNVGILEGDGNVILVVTRLLHASGQWIESRCPIPNGTDMQKMGSAITYARRYSLSAICGIAADEDDDADAVVQRPTVAKALAPPEGFDGWLLDLEAVADEGTPALKGAWEKSQPYLRKFLTDNYPGKWDALKARAAKANKVPVHA